jgi:hypothetical protein
MDEMAGPPGFRDRTRARAASMAVSLSKLGVLSRSYAFSGFGFWLLQGEWDRGVDEFEGSAPGGGGYCEQVEAGLVLAGDA